MLGLQAASNEGYRGSPEGIERREPRRRRLASQYLEKRRVTAVIDGMGSPRLGHDVMIRMA